MKGLSAPHGERIFPLLYYISYLHFPFHFFLGSKGLECHPSSYPGRIYRVSRVKVASESLEYFIEPIVNFRQRGNADPPDPLEIFEDQCPLNAEVIFI